MCGKIFAIIYLVTQGIPENGEVFLRIIHPLLTCFDKTAFQNFCDLFVLLIVRRRNKMIFQLNFQSLFSLYNDFIECFFAQQGGTDLLQRVVCGGENYDGSRPCNFDWVKSLRQECVLHNVTFCFIETGTYFIKDGKKYHIPKKSTQSKMAYKSGMNYVGKPIKFKLCDNFGFDIPENELYVPHYRKNCEHCGSKLICNGCCDCGKCD